MKPFTQPLRMFFGAWLLILTGLQPMKSSAQSGETINLGLYGGPGIDLTYSPTTGRLFTAVNTPASVFYTDDSAAHWIQPFPNDSLEYESAQRGWGGGARRIYTNYRGWVGLNTAQQGGTLTAAVISYSDGDSGTFQTAVDPWMLKQIDMSYFASVTAAGLSDHYFYVGMDKFLLRFNDTTTFGYHRIVAVTDTISGIGTNYSIRSLAVANHVTGYPVFMVLGQGSSSSLFRYDTTAGFQQLSQIVVLPHEIEGIFTHPAQITGDTLFATIKMTMTQNRRVFSSYDGGASWTEITPSTGTNWPLHSADFDSNWRSLMPLSNGLRLSFPGGGMSDDLGANWTNHILPDNSMATNPENVNFTVGAYGLGVAISTTNPNGPYILADNEGMAAVAISKIAHHSSGIYYVATNAGLGYTTAYFSTTVTGVDRWRPPYGEFPVEYSSSPGQVVGGDMGVTAVAVDPNDSQHVVVGHAGGFERTTTGYTGFSPATSTGWNVSTNYDASVRDVDFVTSQVLVAVTGSGSNVLQYPASPYGNIWRSTDGGASWSIVTPAGFLQGNSVEVATAHGDTIIYAACGYWDQNYAKVDGQLWKSTDKGVSWTLVNGGPTGQAPSATTNMPIYDIDIDPRGTDTLYLASGENLDYAWVRSTDGGATYNYLPITPHGAISSVLVHDSIPYVVSCGARRNVFRHNTITGITLTTFNGLPGEFVPDLENGSTLLGTSTGFYKLVEDFGGSTTTWNGTGNWSDIPHWSDGGPGYLTNAIVASGSVTLDVSTEINALNVNAGAAVTLPDGNHLVLNDSLYLSSDATSSGSFIDNTTDECLLPASVDSYLTAGQWHYVASPVTGARTASLYFGGGSTSWLKTFDEAANDWTYLSSLEIPMTPGQGYAVWVEAGKSNETACYRGNLTKTDVTVDLSFTDAAKGWNLIGNPFASAINWGSGSWVRTNTTGIAYVWDNGSYLASNVVGAGGLPDGIIPAGQAFFVRATASPAAVTIPADARLHQGDGLYKSADALTNVLNTRLSGNGLAETTTIGFWPGATGELDESLDAVRLAGSSDAPSLFTRLGANDLSINFQPELSDSATIGLWIKLPADGSYTLTFSGVETFGDRRIQLTDKVTGSTTLVGPSTIYPFNGVAGDAVERFILKFGTSGTATGPELAGNDAPVVQVRNQQLVINWKSLPEGAVHAELFNSAGQLLSATTIPSSTRQQWNPGSRVSGMALVRLTTGKKVYHVKIIL